MKQYKAILWDCDGVLIDSEVLACSVAADYLRELGYPITTEQFIERFMGNSRKQILADILAETGNDYTAAFEKGGTVQSKREVFQAQLKATSGIVEVLQAIGLPMAVASGSDPDRLQFTLGLTSLLDYFNGHIYSAEGVAKGKPAPDIFLHAAEKLGVAPEDCLVVEDGIHGIHAAKAAGMDVIAYIGGSHMTGGLREKIKELNPMHVIEDIRDLVSFLPSAA